MKYKLSVLVCLSVLIATSANAAQQSTGRKPNVVFILADDLGWSDTSLYGTTSFYRTPNIQRLAKRGMRFTRAYSASPLCSPTRASILTGLSPARHGITSPNCHTPIVRLEVSLKARAAPNQHAIQPDGVSRLDPKYVTLAETLKAAGYATGHFGKWHLGAEPYSPLQHGFDVDVPHWHGPGPAGSYVAPWKFPDFDHDPDIPDEHIEDRMAKEAVAFINKHKDEPFFVNYWMFSVHAPFDAKRDLIDAYAKRVDRKDQQRCPTYAAMIESMDDAVGTLLNELDRLEIADNTIIVFASDNGGNMYNLVEGERPTSNRPLRGGKATMFEGGVRTPAVIVWPGRVQPNTQSSAIVQSMDYYPTLLEMLNLKRPDDLEFDGVSLLPALRGEQLERDAIFTYFPHSPPVPDWIPPAISVHHDKWKLIRVFHGGEGAAHRHMLFNLEDDIGERSNLAKQRPERVRELDALIESHLQSANAIAPAANPNFAPKQYDAAREGVPASKFQPGGSRSPRPRANRPLVAGWRPGGTCRLTIANKTLRVQSTGNDPYLSFAFPKAISDGDFVLKVRMKSTSSGSGQVYWKGRGKPFAIERSKRFEVTHDGDEHLYSIPFTAAAPIQSIRIDPSRGKGPIHLLEMRLVDEKERTVHHWIF